METWFTADLHFGHRNIITYCNRPFRAVEEMNHALIENWNDTVDEDDTVWVVGDFCLGKIAETLPFTGELNGRKVLVAGNHDRCWHGHGHRACGWSERYLEAGFDEIIQGQTTVDLGGETVEICHFPYRGDSHANDRFVEHRPVDKGRWLIHGHVHEKWARSGRMINVGVDATHFRPINAEEILAAIEAGQLA